MKTHPANLSNSKIMSKSSEIKEIEKNCKNVRKPSLNTEVMELDITSFDVLLSVWGRAGRVKEDVSPLAWPPSGSASKINSSLQLAPLIWEP